MEIIKKYSWLIGFAFPLFLRAQDPGEELLSWNNHNKLVWNDYKGSIDPSSDAAASTATYLGINYNISNSSVSYKISCWFSKNKSWGRYKSEYILSHEQGHFDITEIFARKLNKMMSDYTFNRNTYQQDLKKIYRDILNEKEKIQNQYDKQTDFSRNKEKQEEWLKKIADMLDDLKEFADYEN
ncbi:MAG TPA: DUF922 domain-containing protein [Chitinophagaceae bacterium]|nr:DUF922 domain-containing protein [Chitinophagaceae bacterium]